MREVPEYYARSTGVLCRKYWSIVLKVPERYLHGIGLAPCEKSSEVLHVGNTSLKCCLYERYECLCVLVTC